MKPAKSKTIIALFIAVLISLGLCFAGGDGGARIGSISVFALCGLLAFAINWLAFIPANAANSERYYDLTGSLTYVSMIAAAVLLTPELGLRAQLAAIMVAVWAVRLGTFLFIRISKDGHDDRFDEIKVAPLRFFFTWTLQAVWALFTAACALAIITGGKDQSIGLIGSIGIIMWLIGFIVEVIADGQKRAFKRNPKNQGRFINLGLWSWSRHPNYFGEILLWCGMAVLAIPVLSGWQWFTLVSPLFVILLLTRLSGIPTLTKKADKKWGNDADYQAYLASTSLLFPRPPRK
ncbi:MAG: steroid 5-alpha reductase family enzyme [Cryomorphaceae bacterium]|jgi:steroid 5-alpha reductase family enzyme